MSSNGQDDYLIIQKIKRQKEEYERTKEEMSTWRYGIGLIKSKKEKKDDLPSKV